LNKQKWDAEKIRKRVLKWIVFFIISFLIANVFLAYLISSDKLLAYIQSNPLDQLSTFISLLIFTAVFYFIFASFRAQVCIFAYIHRNALDQLASVISLLIFPAVFYFVFAWFREQVCIIA